MKEHVLVAQDTSRLGMDTHGRSLLPELMVRAADIPGVEWLRVLYCYPDEVDDTLLEAMASRPNICRYLDLPLQHADPQLLRRMNRRGDIEQTRAFLKKARGMGFTLRTTFITGFPGETDEQFERLMDFVRDVRFDRLGAFCYSAEDDTPAAAMPHQVPEDVKQRRLDRLMTEQQAISLERNRLRVGSEERVLVESVDADGLGVARSAAEAPETDGVIRVRGVSEADIGCFITARITGADTYDLTGESYELAQSIVAPAGRTGPADRADDLYRRNLVLWRGAGAVSGGRPDGLGGRLDGTPLQDRDQLGKFMDPVADKLLVLSTMISLCGQGLIPSWACVVVLFRELAVDGLRLVAMEHGRVIAAGKLGKIKTCTQMAMLVAYLLSAIGWLRVPALNWTLLAVAMAMTLWSGVDYFWKNRALFRRRPALTGPA